VQDGCANEERRERDQLADDEDQHGEDHRLGSQHRNAARHGQQAGADHAGGVLAGDHQHAEDADGELAELEAGAQDRADRVGHELALLAGVGLVPLRHREPDDQRGEAEGQHHQQPQ
jgi:hypothetical protein